MSELERSAAAWDLIATTRLFGFQHFDMGHGTLLIRSGNDGLAEPRVNVDLIGLDVLYLALPRIMRGLSVEEPTAQEIDAALQIKLVDRSVVSPKAVHIIASGGQRHIVIANFLAKEFNEGPTGLLPFPTWKDFRGEKWKNRVPPVQIYRVQD